MAAYYRRKEMLLDILGRECASCGSTDDIQFDHIDPTAKELDILAHWSASMDRLLPEIAKCQPLCIECHLVKTIDQQNLTHGWGPYRHGTSRMYHHHRCRCGLCTLQMRNRMRTRRAQLALETPERFPGQPRGERIGTCKLTEAQAREIVERSANGEQAKVIAEDYPVSYRQVADIAAGRSWKHLRDSA